MKKSLITFCALLLSAPAFSQLTAQQETFNFIFSKLSRYTTQVNMVRTHFVLFDPKITQSGETIIFETPDKTLSIPLNDISTANVENYGLVLTGPAGEARLYMDINAEPGLREKLEGALAEYMERAQTKEYTVYEYTEQ
jgi:hypothetical protein